MSPAMQESLNTLTTPGASASPFPDVLRFVPEESAFAGEQTVAAPVQPRESPFRSVYELAGEEGALDPEAEEFTAFLNELYGFDHGVGHPLLFLDDTKVSN